MSKFILLKKEKGKWSSPLSGPKEWDLVKQDLDRMVAARLDQGDRVEGQPTEVWICLTTCVFFIKKV
jgi:hypothetical protein